MKSLQSFVSMGVRRSLLSLLRLETKNVSATSLEKLCISRDLISQKEKKTDGLWADLAVSRAFEEL